MKGVSMVAARYLGVSLLPLLMVVLGWANPAWSEGDSSAALEATLFEAAVVADQLGETLFDANLAQASGAAPTAARFVLLPQEDYASFRQLLAQLQVGGDASHELVRERVKNELIYIVLLCLLSVVTTTIILLFMRHRRHDARDIVNAAGLNLIIIGTIILVLVVDTTEQLTAAIGVLGATAGYLFRSMQDVSKGEEPAAVERAVVKGPD